MKTIILLFLGSILCNSLSAQKSGQDTTTVLPTDIYSNFSREVYQPSKSFTVFINQEKHDTIRVLSGSYEETVGIAEVYFKKENFTEALENYNTAFTNNHDLGKVKDRYKSACCYAMLNKPDSAFLQLEKIVEKGKYYNVEEIESEKYFASLRKDPRWSRIIKKVNQNKKELKEELDKNTPSN